MGTDIVLRSSGGSLTVSDDFAAKYPAFAPDEEMAEMIADTLGDEDISIANLPRIRVPAAGGTQWAIVAGGEETYVKELKGTLVLVKPQRVFWIETEPSGKAPDCSSSDGKVPNPGGVFHPDGERGEQNPTGLCANCPMSQKGSDPNPKNRGSWCKDQRLLFFVQEGQMFPSIVVAPPSSIREVTQFRMDLLNQRRALWSTEVALTLEKAANSASIEFARIKLRKTGEIDPDDAKAVKDYGDYIKVLVAQTGHTVVDGNAAPSGGDGGGLRFDEGNEDEEAPES
jgi:hypothetical protein